MDRLKSRPFLSLKILSTPKRISGKVRIGIPNMRCFMTATRV